MVTKWGCHGVALDPSVNHPTELYTNVTFFKVGVRTMRPHDDAKWPLVTSIPALRLWLRHRVVDVLKVDCEGCEYSIARDVMAEDPLFFHRVGQFEIEVHVSDDMLDTEQQVINYGKLSIQPKDYTKDV